MSHEEFQRVRINGIKELPAQTELSAQKIAGQTVFEHMMAAFRRETVIAPSVYRENTRLVPPDFRI